MRLYRIMAVAAAMMMTAGAAAHAEKAGCSEAAAIAAAKAMPDIVAFCESPVNGASHGCVYDARPRRSGAEPAGWIVKVAKIHSVDADGAASFMPEGFRFVGVNEGCKPLLLPSGLRR